MIWIPVLFLVGLLLFGWCHWTPPTRIRDGALTPLRTPQRPPKQPYQERDWAIGYAVPEPGSTGEIATTALASQLDLERHVGPWVSGTAEDAWEAYGRQLGLARAPGESHQAFLDRVIYYLGPKATPAQLALLEMGVDLDRVWA